MDNHIFRGAVGGFNRQDVMEYIEKSKREAEETARNLQQEIDALQASKAALYEQLDQREQENGDLSARLQEMTDKCAASTANWEEQARMAETLRGDVARRDQAVRELTEENQSLFKRLESAENELAAIRQDKEKIAQLEIDAHQRAEDIIAAAQATSRDMLEQAQSRAAAAVAEAEARAEETTIRAAEAAESLRAAAQEQVQSEADRCGELFASFENIAAHVASELRKMDVSVAQLPVALNHLKEGLQGVLNKAKER